MKNTSIILAITLFACSCHTTKKATVTYPSPFQFTLIDTVHTSKNDLFVKAHEWVAKTYVSAKDVIQMADKQAGILIVKAVMEVPAYKKGHTVTAYYDVYYTLQINTKDNKYRCVMSDFYQEKGTYVSGYYSGIDYIPSYGSLDNIEPYKGNWSGRDEWKFIKSQSMANANELLNELKTAMHSTNDNF